MLSRVFGDLKSELAKDPRLLYNLKYYFELYQPVVSITIIWQENVRIYNYLKKMMQNVFSNN